MVEKLYGEDVFYEDAVNMIIPGELDAIIREKEINIIDRPSVELVSCTKEEGAVCKATLITKPEVTVAEYKGIHAPMKVREITDEDVDQQIEMLRQRQARMIDVEDRAAENGDEVKINFEGFIDDVAFEGGKGEDYPLRLGSGQFIPGFEDQIVGKNIGDKFDVNVTFPEDKRQALSDLLGARVLFYIYTEDRIELLRKMLGTDAFTVREGVGGVTTAVLKESDNPYFINRAKLAQQLCEILITKE